MKKKKKIASIGAAVLATFLVLAMVLPLVAYAAETPTACDNAGVIWQETVVEGKTTLEQPYSKYGSTGKYGITDNTDGTESAYLMPVSYIKMKLMKERLDKEIQTRENTTKNSSSTESTTESGSTKEKASDSPDADAKKDPLDDGTALCAKRETVTSVSNGKTYTTTSWNTGSPVDSPAAYTGTDKCTKCDGKKLCQGCYGSGKIRITTVVSQSGKADELVADYTQDCGGCDGSCWCAECGGDGKATASAGSGSSGISSGSYSSPSTGSSGKSIADNDCSECGGLGGCDDCWGDKEVPCSKCAGTGNCQSCYGTKGEYKGYGEHSKWVKCSICRGSGECSKCRGERYVTCAKCHGTGKCPLCGQ